MPRHRLTKGRVPNEPLRVAFERSDLSPNEIASMLGWTRTYRGEPRPDGSKVRILLGLRGTSNVRKGKRYISTREYLTEENALAIADVLGLDPVDIGC